MSMKKNSEIILPFWLKLFSSKSEGTVDQLNVSHDSLSRIAKLISSGKTVVLMGKDKPYKIYRDENNEIAIEPIDQFRFR
jgi:hypothetical protein